MKLRKRFLAALVACSMLLTCIPFSGVLAEETAATTTEQTVQLSDIDPNTTVGKAVTELVKLGIINGYPEDNTFRADNTITRGEVSKIIITFLGQESVAYDTIPSGFADVDEPNHWAKKYIKLAADQKIVNGYEDGTFRADNPVRYTEIVKMLVCALGYGSIAEDRTIAGGTWYSGYMAVAAEKGILQGASVNNVEDNASRGTVAILTYNCLEVETASTDSSGNTVVNTGSSAITENLGKEKITGIVTGAQQTGIDDGATGLSSREITVEVKNEIETYQVPSGFDTMSILGRRISAYVEGPDDDGDYRISQITTEKTESTVVTPDMIDSVSDSNLSYYKTENSSRATKIEFDKNMTVIYNGKYDVTFQPEDFSDVLSGQIEFISNDGDGAAEVAFVTAYETFVVNTVDKNTEPPKVFGKFEAGELTIPYDESSIIFSLTKSGSTAEPKTLINALAQWDVISVARSKDSADGKGVWNGIITSKKVSGKIEESESETRKRIGNTFYDYSYYYKNYQGAKPEMRLGDYVTIYLDHEGKIAAAAASATQTNIYVGFVLTAAKQQGVDGKTQISLYGLTGTTKQRTLNLASSVRVDGSVCDDVLAALKASAETANTGKAAAGVTGAGEYSQLIRYTTNQDGEVDMIDTIAPNSSVGEDDMELDISFPYTADDTPEKSDPTLKYTSGGRFVDANDSLVFSVNSSTKVLELQYDNFNNPEKTIIRSYNHFTDGASYRVDAFCVNSTKTASYVLSYVGGSYGTATINEESPMMISTEISTMKDGDDIVDKATGYTFPGGGSVNVTSESEGILKGQVLLGDLFRYAVSDGKVMEIQKILDFGTNKPEIINPKTGEDITAPITEEDSAEAAKLAKEQRSFMIDDVERTDTTTNGRFVFGTVTGVSEDGNQIMITPTTKDDGCGIQELQEDSFTISSAKIFLYDYTTSNDTLKVTADVTSGNIRDYATRGNDASQVLIFHTANRAVKAVIIFQY